MGLGGVSEDVSYRDSPHIEMLPLKDKKKPSLPQPVPEDHGPGRHVAEGAVVLLGEQLEVVGVLPLPLGPAVLEPDLYLKQNNVKDIYMYVHYMYIHTYISYVYREFAELRCP